MCGQMGAELFNIVLRTKDSKIGSISSAGRGGGGVLRNVKELQMGI